LESFLCVIVIFVTFSLLQMDISPDFNGYGQFDDDDESQCDFTYDELCDGGMSQGWIFKAEPHFELGSLDVSHLQLLPEFEPANGGSESSFATDFATSLPSSYKTLTAADHDYSNPIWSPDQAIQTPNLLSASGDNAASEIFCQGDNSPWIAQRPGTAAFVVQHNVRPPPVSSSDALQPMYTEHTKSPFYASQPGFEFFLDRDVGQNSFANSSPSETLAQQTTHVIPSQSRSVTKENLHALKFYCTIRPCTYYKSFARKSDLNRHLATQHYSCEKKLSQCPWPACERKGTNGFLRRDKMLQHQDKVHGWRK